jgi:hypothetical protein
MGCMRLYEMWGILYLRYILECFGILLSKRNENNCTLFIRTHNIIVKKSLLFIVVNRRRIVCGKQLD